MNKPALITAIAEDTGSSKAEAKAFLESFEKVVTQACINYDPVNITGFVKFARVDRAARQGRNPATGESIQIKAKSVAKATALKRFKDAVLASPPKKAKKNK